jgi:BTB/POZ domain
LPPLLISAPAWFVGHCLFWLSANSFYCCSPFFIGRMEARQAVHENPHREIPHWKKEPEEALYSDWKIEITPKESTSSPSKSTTSYAVHRFVLGCRSDYFNRVFGTKAFAESSEQQSKIILPALAAEAFEDMLDYCYSIGTKLNVQTSNAAGLLFLSDYLQIESLKTSIENFLDNDLSNLTCAVYFQHAKDLHIESLLDRIALFCHKNPSSLSKESALSAIADVDLWKAVLKSQTDPSKETHDWSSSLASFLEHRVWGDGSGKEEILEGQAFKDLTDPALIPSISGKVACTFLQLERFLHLDGISRCEECEAAVHKQNEEPKMTSLQERCVETLNHSWNEQRMESIAGSLRRVSPVVLESLLIAAVAKQRSLEAENAELLAQKEMLTSSSTQLEVLIPTRHPVISATRHLAVSPHHSFHTTHFTPHTNYYRSLTSRASYTGS